MEERAYDSVETIDASELERRVLDTLERVEPLRIQATRISAFLKDLRGTEYERKVGMGPEELSEAQNIVMTKRQHPRDANTSPLLTENDVKVMSTYEGRQWVSNWVFAEQRVKHFLSMEPLRIRAWHLAKGVVFLERLTMAPPSANYDSMTPALTRAVASKFAFDCAMSDYNQLLQWSKETPFLMYRFGQDDEAIVVIEQPELFRVGFTQYKTHEAYTRRTRGELGHLSVPVMSLTDDDVSSIDLVKSGYVAQHYPRLHESVKNHILYRPNGEGFLEAKREFEHLSYN